MPDLFSPTSVGKLTLGNHLMRSATAERLSDPVTGRPLPALASQYRDLALGGIGLIVTGHAYIEPAGKAHPQMAAITDDGLISTWRETIRPAQQAGARVMMQINHSGSNCDPTVNADRISPSGVATNDLTQPRAMTTDEVERIVRAFGQAARRARDAGFDGVQLHGAHGYLTTQFLTAATNQRDDEWGGDPERRRAFLRAIIREARTQVGDDFPLWIKLGVAGRAGDGLPLEEGAAAAAAAAESGIDCIEISHALGSPAESAEAPEPQFRFMAEAVRSAVGPDFPLALVSGFNTTRTMQEILDSGLVQLISLCRPLIAESDLPNKLRKDHAYEHLCERCSQCWPREPGEGVGCHNPNVLTLLEDTRA